MTAPQSSDSVDTPRARSSDRASARTNATSPSEASRAASRRRRRWAASPGERPDVEIETSTGLLRTTAVM